MTISLGTGHFERFLEAVAPYRHFAFDTNVCIYHLSQHSARAPLVDEIMRRAVRGAAVIELPGIVLAELLVPPYQSGHLHEMMAIRRLTEFTRGLRTQAISLEVIHIAAAVRAALGLKMPDALVVAGAAAAGCEAVISNDQKFNRLSFVRTVTLMREGGRRLALPQNVHLDDYVDAADLPVAH